MRKIANHGDLIIYPIKTKVPPKSAVKSKLHVLQDSGATGNRHEVVGTAIYRWTAKGIEYLHSVKDFEIRHVGGDEEHGVQKITKGTWEVRHEMEHNPWTKELRIVID